MNQIIEYLESKNQEGQMLEDLLDQVFNNQTELARMTAAKIKATRDIRFDLRKLIKQHDNIRNAHKEIIPEETEV